jgi:hypothetical protein
MRILDPKMTAALDVLNASLKTLVEVSMLPEQDDMSIQRALVAAKAANEACDELDAACAVASLLERLAPTPKPQREHS